ncbi:hypothetical protein CDEF62S_00167 [Castellaniella defragrans]
MTRRQKLLDRFLKTPAPVDFRFDDLAVLLEGLGFSLHENAGGSSHKMFVCRLADGTERRLVCSRPHPGGVLKIYQIVQIRARLHEWGML